MDETTVEYRPDWGHLSAQSIADRRIFVESDCGLGELHAACMSGSLERVVEAVRNGADVEATSSTGERPLHYACRHGSLDIVRFLLGVGSNANALDCFLQTPMFKVCGKDTVEIMAELRGRSAITNVNDLWNNSVLDWACIQCSVAKVRELLRWGMSPNLCQAHRPSPLHIASALDDLDVVSCLLEHGADVGSSGEHWLSPLHVAAYNNCLKVSRVLVKHGALLGRRGFASPLHLAAAQGHLEMVDFLLSAGTDVDASDEHGATALHHASTFLHPGVATTLLKNGANPNAKDNDKFSPLIYLLRHECPSPDDSAFYWHDTCDARLLQIINILLESGLLLGPDVYTYTTEFLHSETNTSCYSRSLLQYDFDSDSDSDYEAWNYDLYVATDNGHLAAVQCLLKAGMQFEQNEWFMDDEWLADDMEYNPESIQMVMAWCKWRHLAGIGPSTAEILNKIVLSCEEALESGIFVTSTGLEDQAVLDQLRKETLEAKADAKWLLRSSSSPRSLFFLCCTGVRNHLLCAKKSYNIFPYVAQLPVPETVKEALKLSHLAPNMSHQSPRLSHAASKSVHVQVLV